MAERDDKGRFLPNNQTSKKAVGRMKPTMQKNTLAVLKYTLDNYYTEERVLELIQKLNPQDQLYFLIKVTEILEKRKIDNAKWQALIAERKKLNAMPDSTIIISYEDLDKKDDEDEE